MKNIKLCSILILFLVQYLNYAQTSEENEINLKINALHSQLGDFRSEIYDLEKQATHDAVKKNFPYKSADHCKKIPQKKGAVLSEGEDPCSGNLPPKQKCYCEVRAANSIIDKEIENELNRRKSVLESKKREYKTLETSTYKKIEELENSKKEISGLMLVNDINLSSEGETELKDSNKQKNTNSNIRKENTDDFFENIDPNKKVSNEELKEIAFRKTNTTEELAQKNKEYSQKSFQKYLNDPEYRKRSDAATREMQRQLAEAERERQYWENFRKENELWMMEKYPAEYARMKGLSQEETNRLLTMNSTLNQLKQLVEEEKKQNELEQNHEKIWKSYLSQNSIAGYEEYRKKHPKGKYRKEAYEKIQILEKVNNENRRDFYLQMFNDELLFLKEQIKSRYSTDEITNFILSNLILINENTLIYSKDKSVFVDNFYLSKFELRLVDYVKIMGEFPDYFKADNFVYKNDFGEYLERKFLEDYERIFSYLNCFECPAVGLSKKNILEFLNKINSLTKVKFRIPTLDEYESIKRENDYKMYIREDYNWLATNSYDARMEKLPNEMEGFKNYGYVKEDLKMSMEDRFNSKSDIRVRKIGSLRPNWLGIYDLQGNAAEAKIKYGDEIYLGKAEDGSCLSIREKSFLRGPIKVNGYEHQERYSGMRLAIDKTYEAKKMLSTAENSISTEDLYLSGKHAMQYNDFVTARINLTKASERNHAASLDLLSRLHYLGYGMDSANYDLSYKYALEALKLGYLKANYNLALIEYFGKVDEPNLPSAFKRIENCLNEIMRAAEKDPYWMVRLSYLFNNGIGVEKNQNLSLELLKRAAEYEYGEAYNNLAVAYDTGTGVEKDYIKGFYYFNKAAELQHPMALLNLASYYASDKKGKYKDFGKQIYYLMKAVNTGNPQSYSLLALKFYKLYIDYDIYYLNDDVWELIEKGKNSNDSNAFYVAGYIYENGYKKTSSNDDLKAVDYELAFANYLQAANLGDELSKIIIGEYYFFGLGCNQSFESAEKYWNEVLQSNDEDYKKKASHYLEILPKIRDNSEGNHTVTYENNDDRITISYPTFTNHWWGNEVIFDINYNLTAKSPFYDLYSIEAQNKSDFNKDDSFWYYSRYTISPTAVKPVYLHEHKFISKSNAVALIKEFEKPEVELESKGYLGYPKKYTGISFNTDLNEKKLRKKVENVLNKSNIRYVIQKNGNYGLLDPSIFNTPYDLDVLIQTEKTDNGTTITFMEKSFGDALLVFEFMKNYYAKILEKIIDEKSLVNHRILDKEKTTQIRTKYSHHLINESMKQYYNEVLYQDQVKLSINQDIRNRSIGYITLKVSDDISMKLPIAICWK